MASDTREWTPIQYSEIQGWTDDDHQAALSCFRVSARKLIDQAQSGFESLPPETKLPSAALIEIANQALEMPDADRDESRAFFENHFVPMRHNGSGGFVTGYFEPEVPASRTYTADFSYPLYARPDDLVAVSDENRPAGFPPENEFGRSSDGEILEYFDRGEIDAGALANRGLELAWVASAIEAFFIHVQGSARLIFADGGKTRVSYAGKSGHPYTSIARILINSGELERETMTMQVLRHWLETNPARAGEMMARNRSYIFFQEVQTSDPEFGPIAAAGVQLTPGRSLAVDRRLHAYGVPVWIATGKPLPMADRPFERLMIAQDTGSAIVGPTRGDLFIGSGHEAGLVAGEIKHKTEFIILKPAAPKAREG